MPKYRIDPQIVPFLSKLWRPIDGAEAVARVAADSNASLECVEEIFNSLVDNGVLQPVPLDSTQNAVGDARRLEHHRIMLADAVRNDAFQRAIQSTVRNGDKVIDVGAGSGILSFFAAQAGAGKVLALESAPVAEDARRLAELNNVEGIIEFVEGDAGDFSTKGPADVVMCEWLGVFLIAEWTIFEAFAKVRDLCLRSGGSVIPRQARLLLGPVSDEQLYFDRGLGFWEKPCNGFDVSPGRAQQLENTFTYLIDADPDSFICEPWEILSLDCLTDNSDAMLFDSHSEIQCPRSTTCHGYVGFFEADLAAEVKLDTSPFGPRTHWRQAYFPIESFPIRAGETLITRAQTIRTRSTGYPRLNLGLELRDGAEQVYRATYNFAIGDQDIRWGRLFWG